LGKDKSRKDKRRELLPAPDWAGEADLLALAAALDGAVIVVDATGALLLASAAWETLARTSGAPLTGTGWLAMVAPSDSARAEALWISAAETLTPREAALRLAQGEASALCRIVPVNVDGRTTRWIVHLRPLPEKAEDERLAAVARSLAEARLLAEGLERRLAEAEQHAARLTLALRRATRRATGMLAAAANLTDGRMPSDPRNPRETAALAASARKAGAFATSLRSMPLRRALALWQWDCAAGSQPALDARWREVLCGLPLPALLHEPDAPPRRIATRREATPFERLLAARNPGPADPEPRIERLRVSLCPAWNQELERLLLPFEGQSQPLILSLVDTLCGQSDDCDSLAG
jgi:hypothetical protein